MRRVQERRATTFEFSMPDRDLDFWIDTYRQLDCSGCGARGSEPDDLCISGHRWCADCSVCTKCGTECRGGGCCVVGRHLYCSHHADADTILVEPAAQRRPKDRDFFLVGRNYRTSVQATLRQDAAGAWTVHWGTATRDPPTSAKELDAVRRRAITDGSALPLRRLKLGWAAANVDSILQGVQSLKPFLVLLSKQLSSQHKRPEGGMLPESRQGQLGAIKKLLSEMLTDRGGTISHHGLLVQFIPQLQATSGGVFVRLPGESSAFIVPADQLQPNTLASLSPTTHLAELLHRLSQPFDDVPFKLARRRGGADAWARGVISRAEAAWLHGPVSRAAAEELVKAAGLDPGRFLVRRVAVETLAAGPTTRSTPRGPTSAGTPTALHPATSPAASDVAEEQYSLCVVSTARKLLHFKLDKDARSGCFGVNGMLYRHRSIGQLIAMLSEKSGELMGLTSTLAHPVPPPENTFAYPTENVAWYDSPYGTHEKLSAWGVGLHGSCRTEQLGPRCQLGRGPRAQQQNGGDRSFRERVADW